MSPEEAAAWIITQIDTCRDEPYAIDVKDGQIVLTAADPDKGLYPDLEVRMYSIDEEAQVTLFGKITTCPDTLLGRHLRQLFRSLVSRKVGEAK